MTLEQLIEYIKIHKISLEQDIYELSNKMDSLDPASKDFAELDVEYNFISGQHIGVSHILDMAEGKI